MANGTVHETLRAIGPTVSVGMLTADLANLARDITVLEGTGVGVVHFDVMDGCFCPMTTIGPPIVKAVRTSMLKDVHLMIEAPLHKVADYVAAGADMVTVHVESERYLRRVLVELGSMTNANDADRGIVRGVALLPGTPVACDDGDACNGVETCVPATGACLPGAPVTCGDGDACNGLEVCNAAATCVAGPPPVVDDGNPCTLDACDPTAGVIHTPVALGQSCSDGNVCNGAET